jgi:hypothetical protein
MEQGGKAVLWHPGEEITRKPRAGSEIRSSHRERLRWAWLVAALRSYENPMAERAIAVVTACETPHCEGQAQFDL